MKIAHVVTYVSEDGAFGGPVAVAVAQASELARRGHHVTLFAGWDGRAVLKIPGVTVRLFKTHRILPGGFVGLISPRLVQQLSNSGTYDAVHVHLARDLITAPAARSALRRGMNVITQTHGMIVPDARLSVWLFDQLLTRAVLSKSAVRLALTALEQSGLETIARKPAAITRIANGVESPSLAGGKQGVRAEPPQVVFLARLHPRKRVMAFAQAARTLVQDGVNASFHVIGPDEGDLQELLRFIDTHDLAGFLTYEGAIGSGSAVSRLSQAAVYVLPSHNEVFPMTVLEALSVGTPVVLTSDCAISSVLNERDAAVVVDGSAESVAIAIRQIIESPERAEVLSQNGRRAQADLFSIGGVVDELERHYRASSTAAPGTDRSRNGANRTG